MSGLTQPSQRSKRRPIRTLRCSARCRLSPYRRKSWNSVSTRYLPATVKAASEAHKWRRSKIPATGCACPKRPRHHHLPASEGPEEARVAHEFLKLEHEGLEQLKSRHASGESIELFQEILKVHFYIEVAFTEGNGAYERNGTLELQRIGNQLTGKFAPLVAKGISLPSLIKALRHIYNITLAVQQGARR